MALVIQSGVDRQFATIYFSFVVLLILFFNANFLSASNEDGKDGGGSGRPLLSANHLPSAAFAKNNHRQRHHSTHLSSQHGQQSASMLEFTAKLSGDSTAITPPPLSTTSTPMMGCAELRSKRYISDGTCTSLKPVFEVVCAGFCLPVSKLPWYTQYVDLWESTASRRRHHHGHASSSSISAQQSISASAAAATASVAGDDRDVGDSIDSFQCVDGAVKRRRIQLTCQDGQRRSYVIRTVRGCKCKKVHRSRSSSSPFSTDNKTVL